MLQLPLPLPPNRWPRTSPFALQKFKDEYRQACWVKAITSVKPVHDPPPQVIVHAMFLIRSRRYFRDEDGLRASLKFVLDTLARDQKGKMRWRQGLYENQGYFVDDGPRYLKLGDVWQERCSKGLECMMVEIVPSTWEVP